jgi:hypothetical protein
MTEAKRTNIKRKVTTAKARNQSRAEPPSLTDRAGEKAIEAKDKFTAFAKQHPIATVAGGLALGILVSGLFRGSPTRKAGKKLGNKAAGLAAIATELALAFAQSAMEAAGEAREVGGEKVGDWSENAAGYVASAGATARETGRSIAQALRDRLN